MELSTHEKLCTDIEWHTKVWNGDKEAIIRCLVKGKVDLDVLQRHANDLWLHAVGIGRKKETEKFLKLAFKRFNIPFTC